MLLVSSKVFNEQSQLVLVWLQLVLRLIKEALKAFTFDSSSDVVIRIEVKSFSTSIVVKFSFWQLVLS